MASARRNTRRPGGNVRRKAPPEGPPITVPKHLEAQHIAYMRRHANLAIAISTEVLAADLDQVLATAVAEIRNDARTDAAPRFRPLPSIRALVNQMRATYRARLDIDAAIDHTVTMQARIDRANQIRWEANALFQIANDPEIPDAVGPAVVATKPQVSTRTRKSWIRRNVDAVVMGAVFVGSLVTGTARTRAKRFFKKSKTIPEEYFDRIEAQLTAGARQAAKDVAKAASPPAPPRPPAPPTTTGPPAPPPTGEVSVPVTVEFEVRETAESKALVKAARETRAKLAKEPGIARRRAKIIGRDQAEKLNGDATEERNVKVGVEDYRWNTQGDAKVRPKHRKREGKIFQWSKPPSDGHPGEPVECRCWGSGDFNKAYKSGQLVARTQQPTPIRRGRIGPIRPAELPDDVDPGQIAFQREVFEAAARPDQLAREERDRRFGAGG